MKVSLGPEGLTFTLTEDTVLHILPLMDDGKAPMTSLLILSIQRGWFYSSHFPILSSTKENAVISRISRPLYLPRSLTELPFPAVGLVNLHSLLHDSLSSPLWRDFSFFFQVDYVTFPLPLLSLPFLHTFTLPGFKFQLLHSLNEILSKLLSLSLSLSLNGKNESICLIKSLLLHEVKYVKHMFGLGTLLNVIYYCNIL